LSKAWEHRLNAAKTHRGRFWLFNKRSGQLFRGESSL
ncbi:MAG: hypothetical protein ACI8PG_004090, partial [Planctomycetota bacterium]